MALLNAAKLRNEVVRHGSALVVEKLTEAIQLHKDGETGGLNPHDLSIRDLAESIMGHEAVREMNPNDQSTVSFRESSDAVDSTAFSNITGQIVYTEIENAYEAETNVITPLFRNVPTRLNGEKIPGITGLSGDDAFVIHEGEEYKRAGIGETFTETPATTKRGLIVPITKEAVFFDRTGVILERANSVGEALGINKENRCIDEFIGVTNGYNWEGTAFATYQSNGSSWTNQLHGARYDLEDWTDIDAVENLFDDIVNPHTGENIELRATTVVATRNRKHQLRRLLSATEIRSTVGNQETISGNPIGGENFTGITTRRLKSRLKKGLGLTDAQVAATWFFGNPQMAFKYMENWGLTTVQAPPNAYAEFEQDIVAQYKASERGVAVTGNPRYVSRIFGFDGGNVPG